MSMTEEYFQLSQQYLDKFGPSTVLLFQCGVFFEVYGYKDENSAFLGSAIAEVASICQLAIVDKKATYKNNKLFMAGFRDYILEKYVQILVDHAFTAVVYVQKEDTALKKFVRVLESIHSPGTHISYGDEKETLSNDLMSIWMIQTPKRKLVYGVAVLNIFTGETALMEHEIQEPKVQYTSMDELEKYISIYKPREVLLVSNLETAFIRDKIIPWIKLPSTTLLHIHSPDEPVLKSCAQQTHQQYILSRYFGEEVMSVCAEFQYHMMATQAFCFLIHFMEEHNKDLLRHIHLPKFENMSQLVILANHTLSQLNIIEDGAQKTQTVSSLHSVLSCLNRCKTAMGKRKFQYILTHPTFDESALQCEYDIMTKVMDKKGPFYVSALQYLSQIKDLDKIGKQIITRKIYPATIYALSQSLHHADDWIRMCDRDMWQDYLGTDMAKLEHSITELRIFLDTRFLLEECANQTSVSTFDTNIIRAGFSESLDTILEEQSHLQTQLECIQQFFETHVSVGDAIKFCQTEKSGIRLQLTKTRSETLKRKMAQLEPIIYLEHGVTFSTKDVKFVSANTNQNEISFPLLDQICHSLGKYKTRINEKTAEIYANVIEKLGDGIQKLETISSAVASMDVVICKCMVAEKYHYKCPVIQSASQSFVLAKGMRHILIEQLQQHELYVANDVSINGDGILLFGTNAVGKTSLMRALGICVIMAQSGMFVPCQSFVYKPYQSIFSRILGNDNLFKGLSTFAMEMSELRVILRQANENSLILGDELCSGTESESATSIFMASLIKLCDKKSSFLFATHFHEIVDKEEIQSLPLRMCHLKVHYDKETDNLIYDRTIQDGPGPRNYGLEVCKSLYMDEAFLETAYKLRSKYFVENEGSLNYKKSPYNARKIKGICEMCGDENIKTHEIHHLQMQQCADESGYIENRFHKNHPANLASVCQKCHDDMHRLSPLTDDGSTVSKKKKKGTKHYVIE